MKNGDSWNVVAAFVVVMILFMAILGVCFQGDNTVQAEPIDPVDPTPIDPPVDIQKYIRLSEEYITQIHAGNIDPLYENLSDDIKNLYTYDVWKYTLTSIYSVTGMFTGFVSSGLYADGYVVTDVTEKNTRYTLSYRITYDIETDKVVGINTLKLTVTVHEPQSSDNWEEHAMTVGTKEYPLNAMLTLPKGVEMAPLVIFVHGSGANDMNETIGMSENKMFNDLAHGLADLGIASLRYDKRTFAYPNEMAALKQFTIYDEVLDDVNAVIKQMSQYNGIDSSNMYVAGHSLGGMLIPIIANENPGLKGVISLAGTLRGLEDIMYDQNMALLKQIGASEEEIATVKASLDKTISAIKNVDENDTSTYFELPASYWYSLVSVDRTELAKQLLMPMLILQGEDDFQVYADVDYVLWQTELADKNNVTYHLYEGLNHIFMESDSQRDVIDITVYDDPANVNAQVINDIADWIKTF